MNRKQQDRHDVLCVDIKSFYASCEAVAMGADPLTVKLAVVGEMDQKGSVVLAASPRLKEDHGIYTGSRLYEIKALKRKDILVVQARMGYYRDISRKIKGIFEEFVPPNQIHTYSVDESWITLDGTRRINGDPWDTALKIMNRIKEETGVYATVGIGDNKFLAKVVLDNFAKEFGIAECRMEDLDHVLAPLPIEKIWGFGEKMKKKFAYMSVYTFGDLKKVPLERLEKVFGKNGTKYYYLARGMDFEPVIYEQGNEPSGVFGFEMDNSHPLDQRQSIGKGITLPRDYRKQKEILLILRELADEVSYELRKNQQQAKTVHLVVHYSRHAASKGFSRRKTGNHFTHRSEELFALAETLFYQHYETGESIRFLSLTAGNLMKEQPENQQEKPHLQQMEKDEKQEKLEKTRDLLNEKFGRGTIARASSLQEESMFQKRSKKIDGHYE